MLVGNAVNDKWELPSVLCGEIMAFVRHGPHENTGHVQSGSSLGLFKHMAIELRFFLYHLGSYGVRFLGDERLRNCRVELAAHHVGTNENVRQCLIGVEAYHHKHRAGKEEKPRDPMAVLQSIWQW